MTKSYSDVKLEPLFYKNRLRHSYDFFWLWRFSNYFFELESDRGPMKKLEIIVARYRGLLLNFRKVWRLIDHHMGG